MIDQPKGNYAPLTGASLPPDISQFDFENGVVLSTLEAQMYCPSMMFAIDEDNPFQFNSSTHVIPGNNINITCELFVPPEMVYPKCIKYPTVFWIAFLLRLKCTQALEVVTVNSEPFEQILKDHGSNYCFAPSEAVLKRVALRPQAHTVLDADGLKWVKEHWWNAGKLMGSNSEFRIAVVALYKCDFLATYSHQFALAMLWAGLEALFAPGSGKIKLRVSSCIASYLEPPGPERLKLQSKVKKLYKDRSDAVHGNDHKPEDTKQSLMDTLALTERLITKIIGCGKTPTKKDLNTLLLTDTGPS